MVEWLLISGVPLKQLLAGIGGSSLTVDVFYVFFFFAFLFVFFSLFKSLLEATCTNMEISGMYHPISVFNFFL